MGGVRGVKKGEGGGNTSIILYLLFVSIPLLIFFALVRHS